MRGDTNGKDAASRFLKRRKELVVEPRLAMANNQDVAWFDGRLRLDC